MKKILVLGANSAIARGAIRHFAKEGHAFFLVGRNADKLDSLVSDLTARGVRHVDFMTADLNDLTRHPAILEKASRSMTGYDTVLLTYGVFGNPADSHTQVAPALQVLQTNLLGPLSLLTLIGEDFEKKARVAPPGSNYSIGVVSSLAGDCGQADNYLYGAAKGGLSIFLEGLTARLRSARVEVLNFKPCLPPSDFSPMGEKMGQQIAKKYGRGSGVFYLPEYGRGWMWLRKLGRLGRLRRFLRVKWR